MTNRAVEGRGKRAAIGRNWSRRWTAVIAMMAAGFLRADTIVVRDVAVTSEPVPSGNSSHGYCEFRFLVSNRSPDEAREVNIKLGTGHGGGAQLSAISRTVTVAPGTHARVSLFQPALLLAGSGVTVTVDRGSSKRGSLPLVGRHGVEPYYWAHSGRMNLAELLISRSLNADDFRKRVDNLFEEATGSSAHHAASSSKVGKHGVYRLFRAEKDVREWTAHWLGLTRYDAVLLSGRDVTELRQETREALRRFVRAGGSVLVMGGTFEPRGSPGPTTWLTADMRHSYFGFGEIVSSVEPGWDALTDDHLHGLMKVWMNTRQPWHDIESLADAHAAFPVTDRLHVPTRGFFLIMLVYSILIGPVAIVVLAKCNRRAWLLWIVPTASLLTCGLVAIYALLSEGIRASVRLGGLTLLDEVSHEATTIGWAGFYSPLTPSGGLFFSDDTELTPLLPHSWRSAQQQRTVDWTHGQHLASGWLRARVPAYFKFRRHNIQRERLDCRHVDGGLEVMNGFGCGIERLHLVDAGGTVYTAQELGPGERRVLKPQPEQDSPYKAGTLRAAYASNWSELDSFVERRGRDFLSPGMYLATLKGAPFMEQGLDRKPHRNLKTHVIGIMADVAGGEEQI